MHNVGVEKAKVLFDSLLTVTEMKCTITRFYMCDLAVHCLPTLEPSLTGSLVHMSAQNLSQRASLVFGSL